MASKVDVTRGIQHLFGVHPLKRDLKLPFIEGVHVAGSFKRNHRGPG